MNSIEKLNKLATIGERKNGVAGSINACGKWENGVIKAEYTLSGDVLTIAKLMRACIEAVCKDSGVSYKKFMGYINNTFTFEGD